MTQVSTPPPTTMVEGLHIGRRDHYRVAADLLRRQPARVALMQRSSTLLLGPEDGWDDEATFYDEAWRNIERGATWFHVASTTGIQRHLRRSGSTFPHHDDALRRLGRADGNVTIGLPHRAQAIKAFPVDHRNSDYKLDRQARMLIADYGGRFEAVVVVDIGDQQCSMHQRGPYAESLFELCLVFWKSCPPLTTAALTGGDPI